MTMSAKECEEYVRSKWKNVGTIPDEVGFPAGSIPELWKCRFDFTKQREKQIAEIEEEIGYVKSEILNPNRDWKSIEESRKVFKRILGRLQAALEEKKRGMR